MTNRKDGGDAFPCTGNPEYDHFMPGMSLRDWFAGMALQGMVQDFSRDHKEDHLAHDAYLFADAMLAEREKAGSDDPNN